MIPVVPVSVWEQISVVIVFAFLLAGLAWLLMKSFSKYVADINANYASIIKTSNEQWQKYFDARSDTSKLVNDQMIEKLERLTGVIQGLVSDFERHDLLERRMMTTTGGRRRVDKKLDDV